MLERSGDTFETKATVLRMTEGFSERRSGSAKRNVEKLFHGRSEGHDPYTANHSGEGQYLAG